MMDTKIIDPFNFGWLETKLSDEQINYLWKCVENRKESYKPNLAGNIHESNSLIDEDDWFFKNVLVPLCGIYSESWANIGSEIPISQKYPYHLDKFWVNYQKQNEFNPPHRHSGVYSFVIWMKIPTKHFEQNQNPISLNSNTSVISSFLFTYTDILGETKEYIYEMNPEMEGTILFFPSKLTHQVLPFYNCDQDRISISGNISIDTTQEPI